MGSKHRIPLREQLKALEGRSKVEANKAAAEIKGLRSELNVERISRVAAQRGLVPYVRALEVFNAWLGERPSLRDELEPVLRELGLWNIELGYDPDKDVALSIISVKRMQDSA